ncbi:twin-arginine translocase TatA/TatE family subunit [Heyndrickxia acidicola]|jgi:sec-independent protein translocase protein TatA|uniref:Sec-independent protein translocase protein TatA n=1 Tax=Heyndrickxia acidicola TaxID=209389 RepID=A0ABU6MIV6_9BACI|nr:twin-arginine translocase TatA/TatE family subunit [Heyndrickxia acidicola]MED1204254.1 twin-arginine translocase TatA/TatE family subunit [Heyndrickxia acidicola]
MEFGVGKIILLLIVALLVFGPKKLPAIGKAAGQALGEFKKGLNNLGKESETEIDPDEKK